MNLSKVLLFSCVISITSNTVTAADNFEPQGVSELEDINANYSVVLFHYFSGDYQQALKELSLVKQTHLSHRQKETHQYFKNILSLSNGDKINISALPVENDSTSMQAVLLAIDELIKLGDWTQAQQLFQALPRLMPNALIAQYAYIYGQLSLQNQQEKQFNQAQNTLDKQSQQYALLLQHQSVSKFVNKASIDDNVGKLLTINNPAFNGIKNSGLLVHGYRYLEMNNPQRAVDVFKNISLNSLNNNAASLGLGLALNELESFNRSRPLLKRVLSSGDPGTLYFEASLAYAYALEKLGNEKEAHHQLTQAINAAKQRKAYLPLLKNQLSGQNQCVLNLLNNVVLHNCDLGGEELNEQFLLLLSSQSFLKISHQSQSLAKLELQYNQQLQTIASFEYLLSHQVSLIQEFLNVTKIEVLEKELADITAQRVDIVTSVDLAETEKSGQFFLSARYLALQKRIDSVFKRMVFLKRAGQKNKASERRVTLLQRIVWWHSFSNFTKNVNETRTQINKLNKQLTNNNYAYQILQDYLTKVSGMRLQLSEIARMSDGIHQQQSTLSAIKVALTEQIDTLFNQFINEQHSALGAFVVNAELARVRIKDASFNRALAREEGVNK
jgi:hypothetical protein